MTVSDFRRFKSIKNSDKGRCTNCSKSYDGPSGCVGRDKISWYDRRSSAEKNIKIVDAISVVFEGLLKMNKTKVAPTEDISMCYDCLFNVSELYRNYREFMGRTLPASFIKELFPKCILWPKERNTARETNEKDCTGLKKAENYEHFAEQADVSPGVCATIVEKIEDIEETAIKLEIEEEDNFDYSPEVAFTTEGSDHEHNDNNIFTRDTNELKTSTFKDRCNRKIDRDPNVVQLPNGKWYIPKEPKILLYKYIPGESLSLDLRKAGFELLGREIKVNNGPVIKIPKNRIYFYRYLATQKLLAKGFQKSCKFCREVFTNKELYAEHIKNDHDGEKNKFQCSKCGKEHISQKSLWNHNRTAHIPKKHYACLKCGRSFHLREHLKTHVNDVHFQSNEERAKKTQRRTERNKRNPRRNRKSKRWLEVHPGEVDKVKCEFCGQVLSSPYMKAHHVFMLHKPESERPFGCEFCERRFPTKGLKEIHEKGHLGTRDQKCETCGKSFITSASLQRHTKTHSEGRPCICEHCGKGYKDPKGLRKHIYVMHEVKGKTQACDICNAKFKTKDAMKSHKRAIHSSADETCLCFECGLKLKTKKIWEKHMLKSHKMNAESVCNICNRGFTKVSEYEEHMTKGYHIKPLWMRPESERKKRNYNVPSYARAKVQRKLDSHIIRREKEDLPPLTESEKDLFIETGMKHYGIGTEPLRKRAKLPENIQPQQVQANPIYTHL